ncbi:hypothetical protein CHUAL_013012 [Chamberlinius hualienensis]
MSSGQCYVVIEIPRRSAPVTEIPAKYSKAPLNKVCVGDKDAGMRKSIEMNSDCTQGWTSKAQVSVASHFPSVNPAL